MFTRMNSRAVQSAFALSFAAALAVSALQLSGLDRLRREKQLMQAEVLKNAPPEYAILTTALGGFRGLLADFLWLRAIRLEKESRHFELVQLYDWIGKLQPRIPEIWLFNSHNLAYNLSISMPDRDDRWLWIQRGVDLILEQGIRYNPDSHELYLQLAWLYLHKIGGRADDYHWHYKTNIALKMQRTLGTSTCDIKALADPALRVDWETFLKKNPDAAGLSFRVEAMDIDLAKTYGDFLWKEAGLDEEQLAFMQEAEAQGTLPKVRNYFAARLLREDWKLEPARMAQLSKKYGEIDWRLSDSVAFYWASKAIELAKTSVEKESTNRIFYFSFMNLFRKGRLFLEPQGDDYVYLTQPELRFAKPLFDHFEEAVKDAPLARHAQQGFLEELVYTLYSFNQTKEARDYHLILKKKFPEGKYAGSLDEFILRHIGTDIAHANFDQTLVTISGFVRQAYWWLAVGEDDRFEGFMHQARQVRKFYMISRANQETQRLALPRLEQIQRKSLEQAFHAQDEKMRFPILLRQRLEERIGEIPPQPAQKSP